jgi:hypothetical protein
MDSPGFCTKLIGESESEGVAELQSLKAQHFKTSDFKSYQYEIATTVAACRAAYDGDVPKL